MDFATCVGVKCDSSGLSGWEVVMGKELVAYHSSPVIRSGKRMGIIVVSDIFGFQLPNCKFVCDQLALKGFEVVMPDFFRGKVKPWPATETTVRKEMAGEEFAKFWASITSEQYWEAFRADIDETIAYLRRQDCVRYGIMGFSWGGLAAETAARGGQFAAAVSAHGCGHSVATYREVKGNILYISVPDDVNFKKESQDEMLAVGAKVHVYNGMTHGFMVRGNSADVKVKTAIDEALESVVQLFDSALLRKPMMRKVGALHPNSRGVTCLVKVLEKPVEVEAPRKGGKDSTKFYEATCGDETGQVILALKEDQIEAMTPDRVLLVRNAAVHMMQGYIRVVVDKWGKLDFDVEESITEIGEHNISKTEHELVSSH